MEKIQALLESTKYKPLSASDSAAMSMLLKNTEAEHQRLINEGTLSGDVQAFTPIMMPMVRRVYPQLIANEILGVQPMSMPTGFIYSLTNEYTGDGTNSANPNSAAVVVDFTVAAGANAVINSTPAVGDAVTFSGGSTGSIGYLSGSTTAGFRALVVNISGAVAAAETITGVTGQTDDILTVTGVFSNEAAFGSILPGYTGSYSTAAAEQLGVNMKEVGFTIARKNVTAVSRALKGQYTVEMYQDLKAQHGLLADEEIMSLMSYEMQAELDREIVSFVNANATQLVDTTFSAAVGVDGRWEIERYRAQAIRISVESAQIGLGTKRGQGNILLVSPKVATMLEQVGTFKAAEQASDVTQPTAGGIAGTYDGRYKVIVDQYATADYCTVLYKGADRRDAMGFFAPYVPMSFTKVTHPDSGQPAVIAKCRYALDTIPGISSPTSNDRAALYARSFGVNFSHTVIGI